MRWLTAAMAAAVVLIPGAAAAGTCLGLAMVSAQLCPSKAYGPGAMTDPAFYEMQPKGEFAALEGGYAVVTVMPAPGRGKRAQTMGQWIDKARSKGPLPEVEAITVDGHAGVVLDASGEGRIGRMVLIEEPGAGTVMLALSAEDTVDPAVLARWRAALVAAIRFPGSS